MASARPRRPVIVAAFIAVLALVGTALLACGGGDDATSTSTSTSRRPTTTTSTTSTASEATGSTPPPAIADAVISTIGRRDPRGAVQAYLEDVLGSDVPITVNDFTPKDATHGEVTWQAGVVRVLRKDGQWFAQEAIGDSVQIAGTSLDVGYVGGSLTLAQAGTVHLTVGDVTWDVRNDVDREGTTVHFEHAVPTDEPVVLRAVLTTDTGYESVAEKVIG